MHIPLFLGETSYSGLISVQTQLQEPDWMVLALQHSLTVDYRFQVSF